jgi:hypothetical protein
MFPTDAKLLNRARERLVRLAKKLGVSLRQSYARVGKLALINYAHAHQFKRANRSLRKLKTYRPPQGTPPHGPKSPCPCQRRRRRARRRRLQLSPPPRVVEVFVAQNPHCAQPTRPAQIRLKSGSSRPTSNRSAE